MSVEWFQIMAGRYPKAEWEWGPVDCDHRDDYGSTVIGHCILCGETPPSAQKRVRKPKPKKPRPRGY